MFEDVYLAWIRQLRQHLETLLEWYTPLDPSRSARDLRTALQRVLDRAEPWRPGERGLSAPAGLPVPAPTGGGTVPLVPQELTLGPRLFKGPLRVLAEQRGGGPAPTQSEPPSASEPGEEDRSGPQADPEPVATSIPGHGESNLQLAANGEVLNPDATFVPGDVLEFPLFRVFALAGMRHFAGVDFNPRGSFLLGTSVLDRQGRSPGAVVLHDNLLAMRFQLLLNAAQGGYCSFDRPFSGGSLLTQTNRANFGGSNVVYACGIVYGGTHVNPSVGADNRSWIHDYHWGGMNLPHDATVRSMRQVGRSRLTWSWTCTPCVLTLVNHVLGHRGWRGAGSVNRVMRDEADDHPLVRAGELDYFYPRMFYRRTSQATYDSPSDMVRGLLLRSGYDGTDVADLRDIAVDRLLLNEPTVRRSQDASQTTDDEEPDEETPVEETLEANEGAAAPEMEDSGVTASGPAASRQPSHLEPGEKRTLSVDHMRRYLGRGVAAVALNGHSYSYVHIRPYDGLLREPAQRWESEVVGRATTSPVVGPPRAGFLSAYNPLTGNPYPMEAEGAFYLFEATGQILRSRLRRGPDAAVQSFSGRPHQWKRVEEFCFQRRAARSRGPEPAARFQIGEGDQPRSKDLISISRFDEPELAANYAFPSVDEGYLPLTFHRGMRENRRGRIVGSSHDEEADRAMFDLWYPRWAVPFSTLEHAERDPAYEELRSVATRAHQAARALRRLYRSGPEPHLTDEGRQLLRANGFDLEAIAVRRGRHYLGQARQEEQRLDREIRGLERQIQRRRSGNTDISEATVAREAAEYERRQSEWGRERELPRTEDLPPVSGSAARTAVQQPIRRGEETWQARGITRADVVSRLEDVTRRHVRALRAARDARTAGESSWEKFVESAYLRNLRVYYHRWVGTLQRSRRRDLDEGRLEHELHDHRRRRRAIPDETTRIGEARERGRAIYEREWADRWHDLADRID